MIFLYDFWLFFMITVFILNLTNWQLPVFSIKAEQLYSPDVNLREEVHQWFSFKSWNKQV